MILLCCKDSALRTLRRLWTSTLMPTLGSSTPTQKGNGAMAETETESQEERTIDTPGEKESRARRIVKTHMWVSMGVGLIPVPTVDLAGITAVQLRMLHELTKLYDVPF